MIWFIIATLVAFFIKGLCGFANTLIFNGILSYTANNINISPLEVVLGYPSNIVESNFWHCGHCHWCGNAVSGNEK